MWGGSKTTSAPASSPEPCVLKCRLAFERTAKVLKQEGIGHLYAVKEKTSSHDGECRKRDPVTHVSTQNEYSYG